MSTNKKFIRIEITIVKCKRHTSSSTPDSLSFTFSPALHEFFSDSSVPIIVITFTVCYKKNVNLCLMWLPTEGQRPAGARNLYFNFPSEGRERTNIRHKHTFKNAKFDARGAVNNRPLSQWRQLFWNSSTNITILDTMWNQIPRRALL